MTEPARLTLPDKAILDAQQKAAETLKNSKPVIESILKEASAALLKSGKSKQIDVYRSVKKSSWLRAKEESNAQKGTLTLTKKDDGSIVVSCSSILVPVVAVCTLPKKCRAELPVVEEKKAELPGLRMKDGGIVIRDSEYLGLYTNGQKSLRLPIITHNGGQFYQQRDPLSGAMSVAIKMGGKTYTVIKNTPDDIEPALFTDLVRLDTRLPPGTSEIRVPDPPQAFLLIRPVEAEFWEMNVYRVRVNGSTQDYFKVRTPAWDELWADNQRVTRGRGNIDFDQGTLTVGDREYSMYLHDSGFTRRPGGVPAIDPAADPQAAAISMFTEFSSDLNCQYSAMFTSNYGGDQMHVQVEDWHGIHVHYSLPFDQWTPAAGRYGRGHLTLETGDHTLHTRLRFRYYWAGGFRPPNNIPQGMTTQNVYNLYADNTTDNPPLANYQLLRDQLAIDLPAIAARFQAQARRWP